MLSVENAFEQTVFLRRRIKGILLSLISHFIKILSMIMDLSRIKKLIKQNNDKLIFLENNEPDLVIMSFAEYEKLLNRSTIPPEKNLKLPDNPSSLPADPLEQEEATNVHRFAEVKLEDLPIEGY